MKLLLKVFFLVITYQQVNGQQIFQNYTRLTDSLRYWTGPNDFIRFFEKGYTLILPDHNAQIKGVIISLDDRRPNLQDTTQLIHPYANAKGFAVLYISSGLPIDLYFKEKSLEQVDNLLIRLFSQYKLPNKNIVFLGVNVSGHRDLKYI